MFRSRRMYWVLTALVVLGLDQYLKYRFAHLVTENTGLAFGLFAETPWLAGAGYLLGLIGFVWLESHLFPKTQNTSHTREVFIGLVVGGALSNGVDRLVFGSVRDVLTPVSWWPSFNVADASIVVGLVCLLTQSFFGRRS